MPTKAQFLERSTIRPGRFVIGWAIALISLIGVVRTFDPISLSAAQVVFLITTVVGVAIAAPSRDE